MKSIAKVDSKNIFPSNQIQIYKNNRPASAAKARASPSPSRYISFQERQNWKINLKLKIWQFKFCKIYFWKFLFKIHLLNAGTPLQRTSPPLIHWAFPPPSVLPGPSSASSGSDFVKKLLYKPSRDPPRLPPEAIFLTNCFTIPPGTLIGPPGRLGPKKRAKWCKTAMTSCQNSLFEPLRRAAEGGWHGRTRTDGRTRLAANTPFTFSPCPLPRILTPVSHPNCDVRSDPTLNIFSIEFWKNNSFIQLWQLWNIL